MSRRRRKHPEIRYTSTRHSHAHQMSQDCPTYVLRMVDRLAPHPSPQYGVNCRHIVTAGGDRRVPSFDKRHHLHVDGPDRWGCQLQHRRPLADLGRPAVAAIRPRGPGEHAAGWPYKRPFAASWYRSSAKQSGSASAEQTCVSVAVLVTGSGSCCADDNVTDRGGKRHRQRCQQQGALSKRPHAGAAPTANRLLFLVAWFASQAVMLQLLQSSNLTSRTSQPQVILTPFPAGTPIYVTSSSTGATPNVYSDISGLAASAVLYDPANKPLLIPAG